MIRLRSYLAGRWVDGDGVQAVLVNPATEEQVADVGGGVRDLGAALAHGRDVGGPALRALTFAERGALLTRLAKLVHERRDALLELGVLNGGNTRSDAKFDVDGASGTFAYYGELGQTLGARRLLVDGDPAQLGRSPRFVGQHLLAPRAGVAILINAFNFPAWGVAEKAACALLAGMPVLCKPASATALLAHRLVELIVESAILPEGALQLLVGPVGDLVDRLEGQDVLAFTGSSDTAARLRGHDAVLRRGVRLNVEADSLNAALLGPDVEPGSPTYDLFLTEVARDITQKAGQKCTAIRRILVPPAARGRVREDLVERLAQVKVGNPALADVTMGPLATAAQLHDVRDGLALLRAESETVFEQTAAPLGVSGTGYFFGPVLLENQNPAEAVATHRHEVFAPVATLCPYDGAAATAAALVARGGGALVTSIYSDDRPFLTAAATLLAPHQGRIYIGSAKVAGSTPGPGTALPHLLHGGPGRAGGGEELGGLRGVALYLQRVALAGDKALLDAITAG